MTWIFYVTFNAPKSCAMLVSDANMNVQINFNENKNRIVETKIIIYKYINGVSFYNNISCFLRDLSQQFSTFFILYLHHFLHF